MCHETNRNDFHSNSRWQNRKEIPNRSTTPDMLPKQLNVTMYVSDGMSGSVIDEMSESVSDTLVREKLSLKFFIFRYFRNT